MFRLDNILLVIGYENIDTDDYQDWYYMLYMYLF